MQYQCIIIFYYQYYHLADKFSKAFEESYSTLRRIKDANNEEDPDRIPTVNEKLQLSYDIFKINNNDMGKVLSIIESSCPNALSKKVATDEVLINFDALDSNCFYTINKFILDCIFNINNNKNRKRKRPVATTEPIAAEIDTAVNETRAAANADTTLDNIGAIESKDE